MIEKISVNSYVWSLQSKFVLQMSVRRGGFIINEGQFFILSAKNDILVYIGQNPVVTALIFNPKGV